MPYSVESAAPSQGHSEGRRMRSVRLNTIEDVIGGKVKVISPDGKERTEPATYYDTGTRSIYYFEDGKRHFVKPKKNGRRK